jgi:aryl-phospho-beta-D-glucosidase BglC (GH1 family)
MEWDRAGWNITYNDLSRIKSWKANVVRYSLNQSYWLDSAKGTLYQAYVDRVVKWTLSLGMDVILDLHWLTQGQVGSPDGQSATFWQQIANKYKNDGRVMFEIYNEPYGMDGNGWEAAMQPLVNAIRTTASANNLILAGGLDWAYHLDQVLPANELSGTNIAYVSHPYDIKTNNTVDTAAWDAAFGNLAKTYPVVATEWGQTNVNGSVASGSQKTCSASFYTAMLNYFADSTRTIGWTGWAWFVDHTPQPLPAEETCGFPQLIISYDGTTNSAGAVVKAAMGG